ncbi:peptidase M61 [Azoarcus sp. DD4]|uniref:M61 family metallopeptidase n=1 Tax=Azoarcus sp. DD4 TaxID=2027405 RepID=UPI00112D2513|nr:PDZ domain-containing protein [Azoarcus sp. DD4]QDF97421.1 peptidase M61 [Azoarcus sp. DD4]
MPREHPVIRYVIRPSKPAAHLFQVSCIVEEPDREGQVFRLPAWIPGSYMIREFARNIVSIHAEVEGRAVALEKMDKHSWRTGKLPKAGALTLSYEIYAWDLSVRAAHLDESHAFFNGTSVFLAVENCTDQPCLVELLRPEGSRYRGWRVATALTPATGMKGAAKLRGFGLYQASDYDELIDHPVEMGNFALASFEAGGVPHDIVLTGRHDCDLDRLSADLKRICDWQNALFGGGAPMDRYVFMAMIVGDGYGGLEHRASTALLASRKDLPWAGMGKPTDGYKTFLGLCSHEYFHTWNVKRIKPAAFVPYDLSVENYTHLLWAFEGFTSYYDDLALVRSGLLGHEEYLDLLGKTISNVHRGPGRLKQSVAESSFDAWIKYYRQDENSPNAIVSYYQKGALIALALDLQLRKMSDGQISLDDVMRMLWDRHGLTGVGVAEDGIFTAVEDVAGDGGKAVAHWLKRAVNGTEELPLARLLRDVGVSYQAASGSKAPSLGIKTGQGNGEVRLASVFDGGPAQQSGLSAGDTLIAIDGIKVTSGNFDELLARKAPGTEVEVFAFRRDELMRFCVTLAPPAQDTIKLGLAGKASPEAKRLRKGWLGPDLPNN